MLRLARGHRLPACALIVQTAERFECISAAVCFVLCFVGGATTEATRSAFCLVWHGSGAGRGSGVEGSQQEKKQERHLINKIGKPQQQNGIVVRWSVVGFGLFKKCDRQRQTHAHKIHTNRDPKGYSPTTPLHNHTKHPSLTAASIRGIRRHRDSRVVRWPTLGRAHRTCHRDSSSRCTR